MNKLLYYFIILLIIASCNDSKTNDNFVTNSDSILTYSFNESEQDSVNSYKYDSK